MASEKPERRPRIPLMRTICYSRSSDPDDASEGRDEPLLSNRVESALSLNLGSGGMLLVMERAPDLNQVLNVQIPTPLDGIHTATLAEVRWKRRLPFSVTPSLYLVGLKFLFSG